MGLNIKAGTITLTTAGTTWDTTGLGFSDGKILITMWNDKTATGITADGYGFGVGFAKDSSNQWSGFAYSQDNVADAVTNKSLKNSVIHSTGSADTVITEHTFNSWIDDGFRLSRTSGSTANKIGYLVIGGPDIGNWDATTFTATTGSASQNVTLGYRPDMLIFIAMPITAQGVTAHASMCVGMACNSGRFTNHSVANVSEDTRAASDTWLQQRNVKAISLLTADTGALLRDAQVIINDTGFTVNWDNTPAAAYLIAVCAIKGINFELVMESVPNTGTAPISETNGCRFTPAGLIMFSATLGNFQADSSTVFGNAINTYGAATSVNDQFSFSNNNSTAQATMISGRSHNTNRIGQLLANTNATTTVSTWEVRLNNFGLADFTLTYDRISASSVSDVMYGVIGDRTKNAHSFGKIGSAYDFNTGGAMFG